MTVSSALRPAVQVVALVLLVLAWYGASREVRLADQWAWGALALGALALSAVGNSAVFVELRRRIRRAATRR